MKTQTHNNHIAITWCVCNVIVIWSLCDRHVIVICLWYACDVFVMYFENENWMNLELKLEFDFKDNVILPDSMWYDAKRHMQHDMTRYNMMHKRHWYLKNCGYSWNILVFYLCTRFQNNYGTRPLFYDILLCLNHMNIL